jgi:hypothetical protein
MSIQLTLWLSGRSKTSFSALDDALNFTLTNPALASPGPTPQPFRAVKRRVSFGKFREHFQSQNDPRRRRSNFLRAIFREKRGRKPPS